MTQLEFPAELWRMVFTHSEEEDLPGLRLVSQTFNEMATSVMYQELTRYVDIEKQLMAGRPVFANGRHVRLLNLITISHGDISGALKWNMPMHAFSTSRTPFAKIHIDAVLRSESKCDMQLMRKLFLTENSNLMARVTVLRLGLDFYESGPQDRSKLANLLSQAQNLEELRLEEISHISVDPELGEILHGCRFPKLQRCYLGCFQADHADLLAFLAASKKLAHLTLNSIVLNDSTWEDCVPQLKELALKTIKMMDDEHSWHRGLIERFFFSGGPNPFKEDAMDEDLKANFVQ
ncbi:MAG: hypothetical protein Q9168_004682 [Polycauliona sp. 1 TL-2023]